MPLRPSEICQCDCGEHCRLEQLIGIRTVGKGIDATIKPVDAEIIGYCPDCGEPIERRHIG